MWTLIAKHTGVMSVAVVPTMIQAQLPDSAGAWDRLLDKAPELMVMALIVWMFLRYMERNKNGRKNG